MAHLGGVIDKEGKFIAKIDTKESGTRFKMVGPVRDDEQQAAQDLSAIRAAAHGKVTRLAKLQASEHIATGSDAAAVVATWSDQG